MLLELKGVQTAYGASQVLFDMNLEINPGEAVTLLGRNGMGKTTTVRSIMGLSRSSKGSISFRGRRIERESADCVCPPELPVCVCGHRPRLQKITRRAVRPDAAEMDENPRARSAVLRVAERLPDETGDLATGAR